MPELREFSLPNVGPGPNPVTLDALAEAVAFVVLLFQRDYFRQGQRLDSTRSRTVPAMNPLAPPKPAPMPAPTGPSGLPIAAPTAAPVAAPFFA